jgi:hypothetical protein
MPLAPTFSHCTLILCATELGAKVLGAALLQLHNGDAANHCHDYEDDYDDLCCAHIGISPEAFLVR